MLGRLSLLAGTAAGQPPGPREPPVQVNSAQVTSADEEFRRTVARWLAEHLAGEFAGLRGAAARAGSTRRTPSGWPGTGSWPRPAGPAWAGRPSTAGATPRWRQQVIFHEEYARAARPARVGYMGEELLGPTLIAFGTPEQRQRFLPPIAAVTELWCQGYSEPGAGSDLAVGGHPGRSWTATVGDHRAEGVDVAGRRSPTGASCWPAPSPARGAPPGCPTCSSRCASRASRSGRSGS